jgi:hypothetical protein
MHNKQFKSVKESLYYTVEMAVPLIHQHNEAMTQVKWIPVARVIMSYHKALVALENLQTHNKEISYRMVRLRPEVVE